VEERVKKTLRDVDVAGQHVLVRVDFNVPLHEGEVADDARIRACLPTIRRLTEREARVILCSHLGRPGGKVVEELRLDPVAKRLSELLSQTVAKTDDCIGPEITEMVSELSPGELMLLENTRFHPGEKSNDPEFAAELAGHAEVFVNDAFAAAHRAHASTVGVAHYLPSVAGLLMERELYTLERVRQNPEHPLIVILGGAKISDKIGVVRRFLKEAETLLIGGGMANTFLKARGLEVGESLIDEASLEPARQILEEAGDKLILPVDIVEAEAFAADARRRICDVEDISPQGHILDIGPRTVSLFQEALAPARMVVWNGPLGVFEMASFAEGTFGIACELAGLTAQTISGGGETSAAIYAAGVADHFTHVSTGGGAFLTFMEGGKLPAVASLDEV
jgi:phosphoglycerate kinase